MKYLYIIAFLFISIAGHSQQIWKGAGIIYVREQPTMIPPGNGAWVAVDTLNSIWWEWDWTCLPKTAACWRDMGDGIQFTNTHGVPPWTPGGAKGRAAMNLGDSLYVYNGGWVLHTPDLTIYATWTALDDTSAAIRGDIAGLVEWSDTLTFISTRQDLIDTAAAIRADIPDVSDFVEYGDSNTVFVTPTQLNDSLANYVQYTDSNTVYVTPTQLGDSLENYVEYSDSNTVFVTPTQLSDSLATLPDSLLSGYGVSGYLPQYNSATTLDTTGIIWIGGRMGVGTASPASRLDVAGKITVDNGASADGIELKNGNFILYSSAVRVRGFSTTWQLQNASFSDYVALRVNNAGHSMRDGLYIGALTNTLPTARLHVQGPGTTSSTTALLVENSAGTDIISANDAGGILLQGTITAGLGGGAVSTNTAFGYQALNATNTAGYNTGYGYTALLRNTSGAYNTAFGAEALRGNTTGANNIGFGAYTLYSNTSGSGNTGIGTNALLGCTTGVNNMAIGNNSLSNITTQSANVGIGNSAGRYIAAGTNNTSSTSSIFIGEDTRPLGLGQTAQIVIGHNGIGLGSNTTRIGNSSTTQTHLDGSLTLGTTTPAASALLTMTSTTQGLLVPRMTTAQRDAIASPAIGLQVYNTTDSVMQHYTGVAWNDEAGGGGDNWGTQDVEIGFGLIGDGTTGNELEADSASVATLYALQDSSAAIRADFPSVPATDLTIGGSGPSYAIESSTGTDVTVEAGYGIDLSEPVANTLRHTVDTSEVASIFALQDTAASIRGDFPVNTDDQQITPSDNGTTFTWALESSTDDINITEGSNITMSRSGDDVTISVDQTLASGIYTPTITGTTNVDATTAYSMQYMRVGSTVTLSGKMDIDPTAAAAYTELRFTLPVASNFTCDCNAGGSAIEKLAGVHTPGAVLADATNDELIVSFRSAGTTSGSFYIHATYQIK